ncbi:unnamed protein product [Echinostoma caproni]|uniref:Uncharacterized protein n=1 Tax=Echinostoma caproni TaxID=27848 RepID=A0A183AMR0_9TREM|nr:unnamed protein product [Echinostoma caproni]
MLFLLPLLSIKSTSVTHFYSPGTSIYFSDSINQAPTLCDLIALNLLPTRSIYQKAKVEVIAEEQAELAARRASRVPRRASKANGDEHEQDGKEAERKKNKRKTKNKSNSELHPTQVDDHPGPQQNEPQMTRLDCTNEFPPIDEEVVA